MNSKSVYNTIHWLIASVWIANGLLCKVLGLVPRHMAIVGRILGPAQEARYTLAIGIAEILMAVWIISAIKPKFCALAQMLIITVMNTIEFLMAPDLLLWGRMNALFALLFIALIWYNEFVLAPKNIQRYV